MVHVQDTRNIKEGSTIMASFSVSYRRVLSKHQKTLSSIPDSMRYQPSPLRVAFTALDHRVLCRQYLRLCRCQCTSGDLSAPRGWSTVFIALSWLCGCSGWVCFLARLLYRKCHGISETTNNFLCVWLSHPCHVEILVRTAERERRYTFHGEVDGQLPFNLIRIHGTVPSINISLFGGRDTNSPFTLDRSNIKGIYSPPSRQRVHNMIITFNADLLSELEGPE